VIVDRNLQLPITCKLLRNYRDGQGRRPWIICARGNDTAWNERLSALQLAGANVIEIPADSEGSRLSVSAILSSLRERGVRTLMVEGGARIIGSFFKEDSAIDTIIVTVAPTFVGANGVGYAFELGGDDTPFKQFGAELIGNDAVISLVAERVD